MTDYEKRSPYTHDQLDEWLGGVFGYAEVRGNWIEVDWTRSPFVYSEPPVTHSARVKLCGGIRLILARLGIWRLWFWPYAGYRDETANDVILMFYAAGSDRDWLRAERGRKLVA